MHEDDLPVVEVEWEDAYSSSSHQALDNWLEHVEDNPMVRKSVGYLVVDGELRVGLLQTVDGNRGDDIIVIPQSLVRRKTVLVPPRCERG